ncbi:putative Ca2+/H+ antiporter (TMEM165/GDT1 family) [Neisseria sp. HSC-16F19]|nr:putative Ca2+/H+ antiporter (TMEM165/GDT1 family) [Neisseria sp. HSC-16F19]
MMLDAFLSSTLAVTLAEIGDKTQLLALFLAARFSQKHAIVAGILVATLLNHAVSAWLGVWLASWLTPQVTGWLVGISLIAVGVWLLKPDEEDDVGGRYMQYGAFVATTLLFFLAEIGDKTQIATVLLAARYADMTAVVVGSTLGMLLANVPVVLLGSWLMGKLPFKQVRIGACVLFCALGAYTLIRLYV